MTTLDLRAEVGFTNPAGGGLYPDLYPDLYPGVYSPVGWTDATTYLYQRNPVGVTRGRPNQSATLSPAAATFTVNNRDGRWTIRNPGGAWYGQLVQNTPMRLSVPSSLAGIGCYLRLETDTASYASCPDSAGLQITSGTLSVRTDCKITDWVSNHVLAAKWGATGQSWGMWTNGDGRITFAIYDGSLPHYNFTPLPLPYFGARIAIRADYSVSAQTVTWYTAPTMGGSWTQLGATTGTWGTNGAPSAISAAAGQAVQVGNGTTNLPGMYGEVYEMQILSTGTLKADPVFTSQTPGATSFTDGQSNTWTLAGTAELSGRLYRFHGELSSLPKAADPSATDVYSDAQATGITSRLLQAQTPADSAMKRAYVRLPASLNLAAYWPGEDLAAATQIGQSVGPNPMGNAGLTMASFSGFACSAPLPVMNGGTATALVNPNAVTWTDNVVRFLLAVPAGDDTNGAVIARVYTTGTIARIDLVYTTGGGLQMNCYTAAGAGVAGAGSGIEGFGLSVLAQCRVSIEIYGNNTTGLYVVTPGGTYYNGFAGTFAGTVGAVTGVQFGGGLVGSAMGHWSVQGTWDTLQDVGRPLNAWLGETAGARFTRLCSEEGYNCRITGPPDKSVPMGYQTQQTISQLLQEIENTDQGLMTEPRQVLGLGYVTNWALCNQPPLVTADYSLAQLMPAFSPASDVQLAVNDVTFTAADGSTARQVLASGPMSVATIGRFDTTVTVNPYTDSALASLANWYLHVRSADEDRYPAIPFQTARTETPQAVLLADIGHYLQVINPPAWVPPGPVRQLVAGTAETFMPQPLWDITFNGIPESPYEVLVLDDTVYGRLDTAGSTLATAVSSSATSLSVATTTGPVWTTSAGDLPFDISMGGERITVTNITGASSPQTFTVTRSVNGVVKTHSTGETIDLWYPPYLGLY